MRYHIEDFNICSGSADYDLFFDEKLREAVTYAINYQMDEYECDHDYVPDPSTLKLCLYPESSDYRIEIKGDGVMLIDSISAWIETISCTP